MRLLERYTVLLLDMNGTFMFGADRFGPQQDYYSTYRSLGGHILAREQLLAIMERVSEAILRDYHLPERFDDFPSVIEAFRRYTDAPDTELPLLERLFAAHEIGVIPADHEAFLRQAGASHYLGIVSNICARPDPWLSLLREMQLLQLFGTVVFSSEGRTIKPSPRLFRRALDALPPTAKVLFIGDTLDRDIIPAKALGCDTAWLAPAGSWHPDADIVVPSLPDLARLS